VSGRLVRNLVSGTHAPGSYSESWGGTDGAGHAVPSGVYFLRLENGAASETRKMTLVR